MFSNCMSCENKHTDYDYSCEHKRLMELSQDLQHRSIVFIRFNPDAYVNQEGVTSSSLLPNPVTQAWWCDVSHGASPVSTCVGQRSCTLGVMGCMGQTCFYLALSLAQVPSPAPCTANCPALILAP